MYQLKKSITSIIIDLCSFLLLTIILSLLFFSNLSKVVLFPLCLGLILVLFYLLYRLINQRTLYIRKDHFIAFNALNGNFLFNVEEINSVKIHQGIWGKVFNIYTLKIEENNTQITTLYYSDNILKNPNFIEKPI